MDGAPPVVVVSNGATPFLKAGQQLITGTADDSPGSGVALVEYRQAGGGAWLAAAGETVWQASVNAGGGALNLEFRATDRAGNQSAIVSVPFIVDDTAPAIGAQVPAVITRTTETLVGAASDLTPAGSRVETVEMQAGDADQLWQVLAPPSLPDGSGQQSWAGLWSLGVVDGENRRIGKKLNDTLVQGASGVS